MRHSATSTWSFSTCRWLCLLVAVSLAFNSHVSGVTAVKRALKGRCENSNQHDSDSFFFTSSEQSWPFVRADVSGPLYAIEDAGGYLYVDELATSFRPFTSSLAMPFEHVTFAHVHSISHGVCGQNATAGISCWSAFANGTTPSTSPRRTSTVLYTWHRGWADRSCREDVDRGAAWCRNHDLDHDRMCCDHRDMGMHCFTGWRISDGVLRLEKNKLQPDSPLENGTLLWVGDRSRQLSPLFYVGSMRNHLPSGEGVLVTKTLVIEGNFTSDLLNVGLRRIGFREFGHSHFRGTSESGVLFGVTAHLDGSEYLGVTSPSFVPEMVGRFSRHDGTVYDGEWNGGLPSGFGAEFDDDGNLRRAGLWKQGHFVRAAPVPTRCLSQLFQLTSAKLIDVSPAGLAFQVYFGSLDETRTMPHGDGAWHEANLRLEPGQNRSWTALWESGTYVHGKLHGRGTRNYPNYMSYSGSFRNGVPHGLGHLSRPLQFRTSTAMRCGNFTFGCCQIPNGTLWCESHVLPRLDPLPHHSPDSVFGDFHSDKEVNCWSHSGSLNAMSRIETRGCRESTSTLTPLPYGFEAEWTRSGWLQHTSLVTPTCPHSCSSPIPISALQLSLPYLSLCSRVSRLIKAASSSFNVPYLTYMGEYRLVDDVLRPQGQGAWLFPNCTAQEYGFYRDGLLNGYGQRRTEESDFIGEFESGVPKVGSYHNRLKDESLLRAKFDNRGGLLPQAPTVSGKFIDNPWADWDHQCHFARPRRDDQNETHWFGQCLQGKKHGFGLLFDTDARLLSAGEWHDDEFVRSRIVPLERVSLDATNYIGGIVGRHRLDFNQVMLLQVSRGGGLFQYYSGEIDHLSYLPHGIGNWFEFGDHGSADEPISGGEYLHGQKHGLGFSMQTVVDPYLRISERHRLEGVFRSDLPHGILLRTKSYTLNSVPKRDILHEGYKYGVMHGLGWSKIRYKVLFNWYWNGAFISSSWAREDNLLFRLGLFNLLTHIVINLELLFVGLSVVVVVGILCWLWSRRTVFSRVWAPGLTVVDLSERRLLFRTLRQGEAATLQSAGIVARDQKAKITVLEHIKDGSKPFVYKDGLKAPFVSQFISTTSDLAVARKWIGLFQPAALIWAPTNAIDLSSEAARLQNDLTGREQILCKRSKEVLLRRRVPWYDVCPIRVEIDSAESWPHNDPKFRTLEMSPAVVSLLYLPPEPGIPPEPVVPQMDLDLSHFHMRSDQKFGNGRLVQVEYIVESRRQHLLAFCGLPNLHWKNDREGDLATQQQLIDQCRVEYTAVLLYRLFLSERDVHAITRSHLFICDARLRLYEDSSSASRSIALHRVGEQTPLLGYSFDPTATHVDSDSCDQAALAAVHAALASTFVIDALLGNYHPDEFIFIRRAPSDDPPLIRRFGFHYCLYNRADDESELNNFRDGSVFKLMQQLLETAPYRALGHADRRGEVIDQINEVLLIAEREKPSLTALLRLISTPSRPQSRVASDNHWLADTFFRRVEELKQLRTLLQSPSSLPSGGDPSTALHSTLVHAVSQSKAITVVRRRVAVIWCLRNYWSISELPSCERDAEQVHARLLQLGFECTKLKVDFGGEDFLLTWDEIVCNLEPDDLLLFYFSGHGFRHDNHIHLCPREYDGPNGRHPGTITVQQLRDSIQKVHVRHRQRQHGKPTTVQLYTVMLLDCCSALKASNHLTSPVPSPFFEPDPLSASSSSSSSSSLSSSSTATAVTDPSLPVAPIPRNATSKTFVGSESASSTSVWEGQHSADIFIACAAMPGQLAYAPPSGEGIDGCSYFTQGLLRALEFTPALPLVQLCSAADRHLRTLGGGVALLVQQVWIECTPSDEVVRLADRGT